MRTTIDLDPVVLEQLKERQRREGKSLGRVASELLARALAESQRPAPPPDFVWTATAMGARVELEDKEALRRALDEQRP
jgi:hypothetical protein